MDEVRAEIKITARSPEEKERITWMIHRALAGKPAYIENQVILNMDKEYNPDDCTLSITVFDDCPEISIQINIDETGGMSQWLSHRRSPT